MLVYGRSLLLALKRAKSLAYFYYHFSFSFQTLGISLDTFFAIIAALPLLVYFYVEEGEGPDLSLVMLLLVAGSSLTGLIKQTFLTLGIAVILVISIDRVWRRRRPPLVAVVYPLCTFGFWLLAGQSPQNIGPYLANASQIVEGVFGYDGHTWVTLGLHYLSARDIELFSAGAGCDL